MKQNEWDEEKEKAYRKKIEFAIKLLQSIPQDGDIELCYSGGKDSDVILELAKMANIPFRAIYKNTTVDPPRTILHAKENGCEIRQPEMTYFQLIEKKGFPSRWFRFCCSYLKEYKICDRAIVGIRRAESVKRAKIYKEPEHCRMYTKNKKVKMYLPILEWTNEEVERFIKERNIKCHPLYYDAEGNFDVQKRLGCMGCPLQSKKKLRQEFKENPKFFRLVMRAYKRYFETHEQKRPNKLPRCPYIRMVFCLWFDRLTDYYKAIDDGKIPNDSDGSKKYLEAYFGIDLD